MAQKVLSTTIKISPKDLKKGVVMLHLEEYRKLQEASAPTYYLTGKKAEKLDTLVERGLQEHREGKTIEASSLKEALRIYERRKNGHN